MCGIMCGILNYSDKPRVYRPIMVLPAYIELYHCWNLGYSMISKHNSYEDDLALLGVNGV